MRWKINPGRRKNNLYPTRTRCPAYHKRSAGHFIYADFFASSKNLAKPISVNGCFNNPKIESKGDVTTSAPASAHLIIWFGERMDAAKISDLYTCTWKI